MLDKILNCQINETKDRLLQRILYVLTELPTHSSPLPSLIMDTGTVHVYYYTLHVLLYLTLLLNCCLAGRFVQKSKF